MKTEVEYDFIDHYGMVNPAPGFWVPFKPWMINASTIPRFGVSVKKICWKNKQCNSDILNILGDHRFKIYWLEGNMYWVSGENFGGFPGSTVESWEALVL